MFCVVEGTVKPHSSAAPLHSPPRGDAVTRQCLGQSWSMAESVRLSSLVKHGGANVFVDFSCFVSLLSWS